MFSWLKVLDTYTVNIHIGYPGRLDGAFSKSGLGRESRCFQLASDVPGFFEREPDVEILCQTRRCPNSVHVVARRGRPNFRRETQNQSGDTADVHLSDAKKINDYGGVSGAR